jgi:AraC family transcriptional activator of mtrCDE
MVTEVRNAVRTRNTVDAEPDTEILCGRLQFEAGEEIGLISALPDAIVLRTAGQPAMDRFRALLGGIREEVDGGKAGSEVIAADLAHALFVLMIRFHLEQEPAQDGFMPLLRSPITSRVLVALLRDPGREWTLDDMAGIGMTSRATLVRAFRKACDLAPMTFLQDLRLTLARQRLTGTSEPIGRIAKQVGYQSEGALSRALHRRYGIRPGALRAGGSAFVGE